MRSLLRPDLLKRFDLRSAPDEIASLARFYDLPGTAVVTAVLVSRFVISLLSLVSVVSTQDAMLSNLAVFHERDFGVYERMSGTPPVPFHFNAQGDRIAGELGTYLLEL